MRVTLLNKLYHVKRMLLLGFTCSSMFALDIEIQYKLVFDEVLSQRLYVCNTLETSIHITSISYVFESDFPLSWLLTIDFLRYSIKEVQLKILLLYRSNRFPKVSPNEFFSQNDFLDILPLQLFLILNIFLFLKQINSRLLYLFFFNFIIIVINFLLLFGLDFNFSIALFLFVYCYYAFRIFIFLVLRKVDQKYIILCQLEIIYSHD